MTPCVGSIAVVPHAHDDVDVVGIWLSRSWQGGARDDALPTVLQRLLPHRTTLASGLRDGRRLVWRSSALRSPNGFSVDERKSGGGRPGLRRGALFVRIADFPLYQSAVLDQETVLHARDAIAIPDSAGVAASDPEGLGRYTAARDRPGPMCRWHRLVKVRDSSAGWLKHPDKGEVGGLSPLSPIVLRVVRRAVPSQGAAARVPLFRLGAAACPRASASCG